MELFLFIILFSIAFGLNVIDAILTDEIIERGGKEKNPVMAWIMAQEVTAPYRWSIKLGIVVLYSWFVFPSAIAMLVFIAPFVWVVWHNRNVLKRMIDKANA